MLVTQIQLVLVNFMERREMLGFHVGYVKGTIPFTFVPFWMKPKECQITVLLHHSDFHLATGNSPQVLY